jgi:hypothetical protein
MPSGRARDDHVDDGDGHKVIECSTWNEERGINRILVLMITTA